MGPGALDRDTKSTERCRLLQVRWPGCFAQSLLSIREIFVISEGERTLHAGVAAIFTGSPKRFQCIRTRADARTRMGRNIRRSKT